MTLRGGTVKASVEIWGWARPAEMGERDRQARTGLCSPCSGFWSLSWKQ